MTHILSYDGALESVDTNLSTSFVTLMCNVNSVNSFRILLCQSLLAIVPDWMKSGKLQTLKTVGSKLTSTATWHTTHKALVGYMVATPPGTIHRQLQSETSSLHPTAARLRYITVTLIDHIDIQDVHLNLMRNPVNSWQPEVQKNARSPKYVVDVSILGN